MRLRRWGVWLATVLLVAATFTLEGQAPAGQSGVTFQRLLNAADEPGNWLMYSHTYNSWRLQHVKSDQCTDREKSPREMAVSGPSHREI